MLVTTDNEFEGVLYSVSAQNVSALHSEPAIEYQAEKFLLAHFEAQGIRIERGYMGGIGAAAGVSAVLQWFAENWEDAVAIATLVMGLVTKLRGTAKRFQQAARERLIERYNPSLVVRLQTAVREPNEVAESYRSLVMLVPGLLDESRLHLPHQTLSLLLIDGSRSRYAAPLRVDASKFSAKEAHKHLKRMAADNENDSSPLIYHQRVVFGLFRRTERINDQDRFACLLFS